MAIKIRIPKSGGEIEPRKIWGLPRDPILRAAFVAFLILAVTFTIVFSYFYIKYDRIPNLTPSTTKQLRHSAEAELKRLRRCPNLLRSFIRYSELPPGRLHHKSHSAEDFFEVGFESHPDQGLIFGHEASM